MSTVTHGEILAPRQPGGVRQGSNKFVYVATGNVSRSRVRLDFALDEERAGSAIGAVRATGDLAANIRVGEVDVPAFSPPQAANAINAKRAAMIAAGRESLRASTNWHLFGVLPRVRGNQYLGRNRKPFGSAVPMADNIRSFALAAALVALVSLALLESGVIGDGGGGVSVLERGVGLTPAVLGETSPLIVLPPPVPPPPPAPTAPPSDPPTPAPAVTLAPGGDPIAATFEVPILMYHRVQPKLPDDDAEGLMTVTTTELEDQLAYLRCAGYTAMTVGQLFDVIDGSYEMPERPIVLTFDDGLIDHYAYAFPLLRRYGLPASFAILTGLVGQSEDYMTWDQIREMSGAGIEMLSHTASHLNLNEADDATIADELAASKAKLEEETGKAANYFVYPSGEPFRSGTLEQEAKVVAMLRDAGYHGALLAGRAQVTQDASRPFELHRMRIWSGQDISVFAGAMYGPAPDEAGCSQATEW